MKTTYTQNPQDSLKKLLGEKVKIKSTVYPDERPKNVNEWHYYVHLIKLRK